MTFERAISANEKLYLASEGLSPPFAIQIVVLGKGLDVRALEHAVAAASDACPGARLVADTTRGVWRDEGKPPPVRMVDARFTLDRPELHAPLEGTTCEVLVWRDALVFRAVHGVMDGKGALVWVQAVFQALRGEPIAGARATETDAELRARVAPAPRIRPRVTFDSVSPFHGVRHAPNRYTWMRTTLRGSRARAALVAKLAATLAQGRGERLRCMVPVDLRRHAPGLASTANLTLPVFLDVAPGEAWEDVHERLLGALAEGAELQVDGSEWLMNRLPRAGLSALMRASTSMERMTGRYLLASTVISHLGKIALEDVSCRGFVADAVVSLPVHAPLAPLSIVALEQADRVELCLSVAEGEGAAEQVAALLHRIACEFDEAPETPTAESPEADLTGPDAPLPDVTIVGLFAAQVERSPDAIALVCGERTRTYAELDRQADAVAAALIKAGVGPGALVALLADRTEEAIAAILAVLRCGAAYVPIDPLYPEERIAVMLADARVAVCLASRGHAPRAKRAYAGAVLELEGLTQAAPPTRTRPTAQDRAYVIYTSGSTGRPKGVQIEHRALTHYVLWAVDAYRVDASTRFALFTSLAFDLTITSLFVPLVAGGSVALFPEEIDHLTLRRVLTARGVNALKVTPTHLELMSGLDVRPKGFRVVVVGGEQLRGPVAARAHELFRCPIINEYGPTETTVGCITHTFDPTKDGATPAVPIGLPMSRMRVALRDGEGRTLRRGETGELFLAGDGLARGYLGREDLDRERFVRLEDGVRAYRTGDLARVLESGRIEYLGRKDEQVKIRGHRVEPGEVETILAQHDAVAQVVVLGRARPGQSKVLCAYVVAKGAVTEETLRAYCEERLPPAMVPTFVMRVPEIPWTVNGKVDARALPDPFAISSPEVGVAGPGDDTERQVATIWSELLDVEPSRLGPNSDFHRLGGDSLKMIEMLASVARQVVGHEREQAFMARVRPVLRRPTLENVCRVAKEVGQ